MAANSHMSQKEVLKRYPGKPKDRAMKGAFADLRKKHKFIAWATVSDTDHRRPVAYLDPKVIKRKREKYVYALASERKYATLRNYAFTVYVREVGQDLPSAEAIQQVCSALKDHGVVFEVVDAYDWRTSKNEPVIKVRDVDEKVQIASALMEM